MPTDPIADAEREERRARIRGIRNGCLLLLPLLGLLGVAALDRPRLQSEIAGEVVGMHRPDVEGVSETLALVVLETGQQVQLDLRGLAPLTSGQRVLVGRFRRPVLGGITYRFLRALPASQ